MSYSITIPATEQIELIKAVEGILADHHATVITPSDNQPTEEVGEHLVAIREAVEAIACVLGRPGDKISVTISGHANPDHAPAEGWANEMINISMNVTDVQRPAAE